MTSRSTKWKTRSSSRKYTQRALVVVRCGARGLACFHFTIVLRTTSYSRLSHATESSLSFAPFLSFLLLRLPLLLHKQQLTTFFAQTYFLFSSLPFFILHSSHPHYHTRKNYFASMLSEIKAQLNKILFFFVTEENVSPLRFFCVWKLRLLLSNMERINVIKNWN